MTEQFHYGNLKNSNIGSEIRRKKRTFQNSQSPHYTWQEYRGNSTCKFNRDYMENTASQAQMFFFYFKLIAILSSSGKLIATTRTYQFWH